MKQLIIILFIASSTNALCQDIAGCETVSLEDKTKIKASEPCILKLAEYALSQPITGYPKEAHYARKTISGWLEATPDYSFNLTTEVMKLFKGDNLLLFSTYLCCLAKASLTEGEDFHKVAIGLLVDYVKNPKNKVKQSKQIKKLIKSWDNDNIEAYLN